MTSPHKMMTGMLAVVLALICLAGCATAPDRQTNRVIISGVQDGLHCPPGQAQKGRC